MKPPVLFQAIFLLALLPLAGCGKTQPSSEPENGGTPEKAASSETVPANEKTEPASPQAEPAPAEKPEKEPKPAIASAIESLTGSLGYNLDGQEEGNPKAELEKGLSLQKQGRYTRALEVLGGAIEMKAPNALRAEIPVSYTHLTQPTSDLV